MHKRQFRPPLSVLSTAVGLCLSVSNKKAITAVPIERKENFLQQAAFAPAVGFGRKKRAVSFDTALDFYYYLIRLWIYSKLFLAL